MLFKFFKLLSSSLLLKQPCSELSLSEWPQVMILSTQLLPAALQRPKFSNYSLSVFEAPLSCFWLLGLVKIRLSWVMFAPLICCDKGSKSSLLMAVEGWMKCVLNKVQSGCLSVQVFWGLAACAGVGLQCPAGAQSHGHPWVQSCRLLAPLSMGNLSSGSRWGRFGQDHIACCPGLLVLSLSHQCSPLAVAGSGVWGWLNP